MFMSTQALTKDITRKVSKGLIDSILKMLKKVQAMYIKQGDVNLHFYLGCDKTVFFKLTYYVQDKRI